MKTDPDAKKAAGAVSLAAFGNLARGIGRTRERRSTGRQTAGETKRGKTEGKR